MTPVAMDVEEAPSEDDSIAKQYESMKEEAHKAKLKLKMVSSTTGTHSVLAQTLIRIAVKQAAIRKQGGSSSSDIRPDAGAVSILKRFQDELRTIRLGTEILSDEDIREAVTNHRSPKLTLFGEEKYILLNAVENRKKRCVTITVMNNRAGTLHAVVIEDARIYGEDFIFDDDDDEEVNDPMVV